MAHTDHPRTRKTPQQRAAERLEVAKRAHSRATKWLRAAKAEHESAIAEESLTKARLLHAGQDPDLPKTVDQDTAGGIGSTETTQS
jgi:hypothetical protein